MTMFAAASSLPVAVSSSSSFAALLDAPVSPRVVDAVAPVSSPASVFEVGGVLDRQTWDTPAPVDEADAHHGDISPEWMRAHACEALMMEGGQTVEDIDWYLRYVGEAVVRYRAAAERVAPAALHPATNAALSSLGLLVEAKPEITRGELLAIAREMTRLATSATAYGNGEGFDFHV